jgi:ATP-dependent Clp protease adaptor protein ClpS|tara:strand:+ start:801 stop:1172 length:372 start_codon:yes stop_codon:yes gene_type:complete
MKHLDVAEDQTPNDEGVITEDKPRKGATARGFKRVRGPQKPGKFAVVLHNDDYTPMDFVVFVLQEVFYHPFERAERIMLSVHTEGIGVAGIYHFEIAEQKAYDTAELAKENQYPLKITIEEIA